MEHYHEAPKNENYKLHNVEDEQPTYGLSDKFYKYLFCKINITNIIAQDMDALPLEVKISVNGFKLKFHNCLSALT